MAADDPKSKAPGAQTAPKSLEARVAELEDRLSQIHITEEELKAYQKVSALIGGGAQPNAGCVVDCVSGCLTECLIRACTIRACTIRACTIISQCINECGGGLPGGGFGRSGGGFGSLGG